MEEIKDFEVGDDIKKIYGGIEALSSLLSEIG